MLLNLDYETYNIPDSEASIDIKALEAEPYQKLVRFLSSLDLLKSKKNEEVEENEEVEKKIDSKEVENGLKQMGDANLLKIIQEIIPKYCSNLQGVKVRENGKTEDATVEAVIRSSVAVQFFLPILMKLFSISTLSKEESETLKKP